MKSDDKSSFEFNVNPLVAEANLPATPNAFTTFAELSSHVPLDSTVPKAIPPSAVAPSKAAAFNNNKSYIW